MHQETCSQSVADHTAEDCSQWWTMHQKTCSQVADHAPEDHPTEDMQSVADHAPENDAPEDLQSVVDHAQDDLQSVADHASEDHPTEDRQSVADHVPEVHATKDLQSVVDYAATENCTMEEQSVVVNALEDLTMAYIVSATNEFVNVCPQQVISFQSQCCHHAGNSSDRNTFTT